MELRIGFRFGAASRSTLFAPVKNDVSIRLGETDRRLALAEETVGVFLCVRPGSWIGWSLGLSSKIIELIGLKARMLALIDEPDSLNRLMAWTRDEPLHDIECIEQRGPLSPIHADQYVGSGGFGYTDELHPNGAVRLADIWGFAESRERVWISPDMFAAFVLPYPLPILEKFGLNCGGYCEPLHQRWQHVEKVPRLRRMSVSPWADQVKIVGCLGKDCVHSRKPNPAPVCIGLDEHTTRKDIEHTRGVAEGCCVEITLKDTTRSMETRTNFGVGWTSLGKRFRSGEESQEELGDP